MKKTPEVFLVAGEESANQYASKIIESFKGQPLKFSGIGFKTLSSDGFHQVYDAKNLAVMGSVELFSKYFKFKEAFQLSLNYIKENKPEVVLLIDFGGFNLRLAKKVKELGLKTKILYFISPKIWAWNQKRALKVKNYVDEMYVIHPFEVDFYKKWGVSAKFVGHPLLQEIDKKFFDRSWTDESKKKLGINIHKRVLGVLPGSREGEISRLLTPFAKAAQSLQDEFDFEVVFVVPPSKDLNQYLQRLPSHLKGNVHVLQSKDPMELMALCDLFLVASGTATLQVGLLGKPMAIAYKMNPITMFLAKKFVTGVKYAGLVNIIGEKEISKEFLQEDCTEQNLLNYIKSMMLEPKLYEEQKSELLSLKGKLGAVNTYEVLRSEIERFL